MSTQSSERADAFSGDPASLWVLIPATEYQVPAAPAASAARARWTSLRRLFGGSGEAVEQPARALAELHGLSPQRLDALVAPLCWEAGAAALEDVLADGDNAAPVSFLVGPPRSGHAELLRCWARQQGAPVVDAPDAAAILAGGRDWLDARLPEQDDARADAPTGQPGPWVLPRLEHCWLRHAAGLDLVRELLARALDGALGRGVIACDSWAWAFLRHVAPLPSRPPWTLCAFDGERLAALLRALVASDGSGPVHFRNAQTGKPVLTVAADDGGSNSNALQSLAARCRGNAGLARLVWRALLRAEPERDAGPQASADAGTTIWVAPWPAATPLGADADADEPLALLIHALLLHDGLPAEQLAELLPLRRFRVQAMLLRLAEAGAVRKTACGRWRISAAGYPEARELLRAQGLLLDDF
jgi:hypothetical protein